MKRKIIFISCLFVHTLGFSQYPDWKYYSSSPFIESIAQEGNYVWIGTYGGLIKHNTLDNSNTFFNRTNSPFVSNTIYSVTVDHQNRKWIKTYERNLYMYDDFNWTVYDTSDAPIPPGGMLKVDTADNIWLVSGTTVLKFDGTSWTGYDTSVTGLGPSAIYDFFITRNNRIIISSTWEHLIIYDGVSWTDIDLNGTGYTTYGSNVADDSYNNLWISMYGGLLKYDGSTFTYTNFPSNTNSQTSALAVDDNNLVYIATGSTWPATGGISVYNGNTWTKYDRTNSIFDEEHFKALLVDSANRLWAGGYTGELVELISNNISLHDISGNSLHNDYISRVLCNRQSNKNYFQSSTNVWQDDIDLLSIFDGVNWNAMEEFNAYTMCFTSDSLSNVYIKTMDSIMVYDGVSWSGITHPNSGMPSQYQPSPSLLIFDKDKKLWGNFVAYVTVNSMNIPTFHQGISRYDTSGWMTFSNLNSNLSDGAVTDIKADMNNNIWVANNIGLSYFDGNNWTNFNSSNSPLGYNHTQCIAVDKNNIIWTTGDHFVLNKFDGISWTQIINPLFNASAYGHYISLAIDTDNTVWGIGMGRLYHYDGSNWTEFNSQNSPVAGALSIDIDNYGNKFIGTSGGLLVYRQGGVDFPYSVPEIPGIRISNSIFISPNPATSQFTISNSQFPIHNIEMYSVLGERIFSHLPSAFSHPLTIDVSSLPAGVYFVKLINEQSSVTRKIVVQH